MLFIALQGSGLRGFSNLHPESLTKLSFIREFKELEPRENPIFLNSANIETIHGIIGACGYGITIYLLRPVSKS